MHEARLVLDTPRSSRSTPPEPAAAPPAAASPARSADAARRPPSPRARTSGSPHSAPPWPARTARVAYSSDPPIRPSCSPSSSVRSNLAAACAPASASTCSPGSLSSPSSVFCHANITWNSGLCDRLRSGLQQLHHLLERHVLMLLRPQRHLLHPLQQLPPPSGCPPARCAAPACSRRTRSAPRSPLASRFAVGVPITTSSWPAQTPQHHRPARQQRHEQRHAVAAG